MLSYPCHWRILSLDLIVWKWHELGLIWMAILFLHAIWKMPSPTSLSEVADLCLGQDLGSRSLGKLVTLALVLASTDDLRVPGISRAPCPEGQRAPWVSAAVAHLLLHMLGSLVAPCRGDGCLVVHSLHHAAVPGHPLCNGRQTQQPYGSNQSAVDLACAWRREHLAHQWVLRLGLLPRQLHAARWMCCRYGSDWSRSFFPPAGCATSAFQSVWLQNDTHAQETLVLRQCLRWLAALAAPPLVVLRGHLPSKWQVLQPLLGNAAVVARRAVQLRGSKHRNLGWNVRTDGSWSNRFASNCIVSGGGSLEPLGHVSLLGLVLCVPLSWQRRASGREWPEAPSGPCPAEGTSVEVVVRGDGNVVAGNGNVAPGKSRQRHWRLLLWHSVGFEWDWDLHLHRQLSICWLLWPGLCFVLWAATGHRWFPHLPSGSSNSWSEGCLTDGLRRLTLTEKSVEAPLQLLVQFFSFLYVTSNDYAVISFSVSMLLSLSSVVDAAYTLMELNLLPELSAHKVSTSYLSVQTNSKEVQLGDGKDVAKWSLRAMSGVQKNTRRQIARKPKKLFQRYWINGQWIHALILAGALLKMYWIQRRSLFLFVFCWLLCHSGGLVICCFLCRGAPHSFEIFFLVPMEGPWNCGYPFSNLRWNKSKTPNVMWPTDLHGLLYML